MEIVAWYVTQLVTEAAVETSFLQLERSGFGLRGATTSNHNESHYSNHPRLTRQSDVTFFLSRQRLVTVLCAPRPLGHILFLSLFFQRISLNEMDPTRFEKTATGLLDPTWPSVTRFSAISLPRRLLCFFFPPPRHGLKQTRRVNEATSFSEVLFEER